MHGITVKGREMRRKKSSKKRVYQEESGNKLMISEKKMEK